MNTLKYGSVAVGAPNSAKRILAEIKDCAFHITAKRHSYAELSDLQVEIILHAERLDDLFN